MTATNWGVICASHPEPLIKQQTQKRDPPMYRSFVLCSSGLTTLFSIEIRLQVEVHRGPQNMCYGGSEPFFFSRLLTCGNVYTQTPQNPICSIFGKL